MGGQAVAESIGGTLSLVNARFHSTILSAWPECHKLLGILLMSVHGPLDMELDFCSRAHVAFSVGKLHALSCHVCMYVCVRFTFLPIVLTLLRVQLSTPSGRLS